MSIILFDTNIKTLNIIGGIVIGMHVMLIIDALCKKIISELLIIFLAFL